MIRIGLLEDDEDTRDFIAGLIRSAENMDVVMVCPDLRTALRKLPTVRADLFLVDLQLPDGNGLDLVRKIKSTTKAKVLILTVLGDKSSVLVSFEVGANGYLLKDTPPNQILRDIRAVVAGGNPVSPQAATHLLGVFRTVQKPARQDQPDNSLTEREKDVLTMFSRGLSYKETADALNISAHTVSDYVKSIYRKLSVHSRNEAIFEAVQNGWLDI